MDFPSDLKPDLHKILLGPLSIIGEIYGALLPGCIFILLLILKGNVFANKLISSPFLGYKTKIVSALVIAYVIGKVVASIIALCEPIFVPEVVIDQGPLKSIPKEARDFVAGAAGASFLAGRTGLYDHFSVFRSQLYFSLCSGLIFLIAAVLPGDGNLRYAEVAAGGILIACGITNLKKQKRLVTALLGASLGLALSEIPIEKLLTSGWALFKTWNELAGTKKNPEETGAVATKAAVSESIETPLPVV